MSIYDKFVGRKFAKLTVIEQAPRVDGARRFHCECECGRKTTTYAYDLLHGRAKSCGCGKISKTTHGLSRTPEYRIWADMRQRCNNIKNKRYDCYGGRGITVCKEWDCEGGFLIFLAAVGTRPSRGYSLDRIDVNGHYEPGNVRWATMGQQNANRRKVGSIDQFSMEEVIESLVSRVGRDELLKFVVDTTQ